jgi:predicted lipoprotein with Yx(FWY)xxD motif
MRLAAGLAAFGFLAMAGAAWASPPGVTEKEGAFVAPDGKALYTFARDMAPGKSSCNAGCAAAWPPLVAAAGATDDGEWTVITRDDGSKQWAYKGKSLYTYVKDTVDGKATGVSPAWPLAVK